MNPRYFPAFIKLLCCSLILLSIVSATTHACICLPWSVAQKLEWADAVFSAVVVSISPDTCNLHRQIELVLTRTWKGLDTCNLTLLDELTSCSPYYIEGAEYLIFARESSDLMCRPGLYTNFCLTYPIQDAEAVMDTLDYYLGWTLLAEWGSPGSGDGEFDGPGALAMDAAGNLYITDIGNHRIQKFDGDGNFITRWGEEGTGDGQFSSPHDVYVDAGGNVFVADSFNDRVQKFTSSGVFLTKWGGRGSGEGEFVVPSAIAVDGAGYVYVVDAADRIQKFTNEGTFVDQWGEQGDGPGQLEIDLYSDIEITADSLLYVADTGNQRIQLFTTEGVFVAIWNGSCAPDGNWFPNTPACLTADLTGNIFVGFAVSGQWPIGPRPGVVRYNEGGLGTAVIESPSAFGIACATDGRVYITGPYDGVKVYEERTSIPSGVQSSTPFERTELKVFPNPFNPATQVYYRVETPGLVKITVHDVRGRLIRHLVHRNEDPGERWVMWDARDDRGMEVSSGVYFIKFETSGKVATRKITLLK